MNWEWDVILGAFPILNALILIWVACHLLERRWRKYPLDRCPITQSDKCVLFSDSAILYADCRAKIVGLVRKKAQTHG